MNVSAEYTAFIERLTNTVAILEIRNKHHSTTGYPHDFLEGRPGDTNLVGLGRHPGSAPPENARWLVERMPDGPGFALRRADHPHYLDLNSDHLEDYTAVFHSHIAAAPDLNGRHAWSFHNPRPVPDEASTWDVSICSTEHARCLVLPESDPANDSRYRVWAAVAGAEREAERYRWRVRVTR